MAERLDLDGAVALVTDRARRALQDRGRVDVVVPGGRGPRRLLAQLRRRGVVGAGWHLHLSDERCVAPDDPARNALAVTALLGLGPDGAESDRAVLHAPDPELPSEVAAERYAAHLSSVPRFDLVVLGLGADGHVASLFPGTWAGFAPDAPDALAVVVPGDVHPLRISMSARALGRTEVLLLVIDGAGKDAALAAFEREEDVPARAIRGPHALVADLRTDQSAAS